MGDVIAAGLSLFGQERAALTWHLHFNNSDLYTIMYMYCTQVSKTLKEEQPSNSFLKLLSVKEHYLDKASIVVQQDLVINLFTG